MVSTIHCCKRRLLHSEASGAGNALQKSPNWRLQEPHVMDSSGLAHHQELDKSQEIPGIQAQGSRILWSCAGYPGYSPMTLDAWDPLMLRLWAAVCCSWSALEKSTRWQNSVCRKWPLSKDLLRKPLHNLARMWSFEAPKNGPISSYSTTATGIPPTLSEPRMCQAMQACQIQGHMSTGGLGSIAASTICQESETTPMTSVSSPVISVKMTFCSWPHWQALRARHQLLLECLAGKNPP